MLTDSGRGRAVNADPAPKITPAASSSTALSALNVHPLAKLLEVLGFRADERVSVCHSSKAKEFRSEVVTVRSAPQAVRPRVYDWWFSTAPLRTGLPRGRRGTASDVVGVRCLFADLDYEPGKARDAATAHAITDGISARLGTQPVARVHSGHGLQPYWQLQRDATTTFHEGDDPRRDHAAAVLARFAGLVREVAAEHDAAVDSVYELARVLRVPGTTNNKVRDLPVPTSVEFCEGGQALTLAEVNAACPATTPASRAPTTPAAATSAELPAPAARALEGVHPYFAAAIEDELARLDQCQDQATPDGTGYTGPPWNGETFEVACNLQEIANTPSSGYSRQQAQADLRAHAPRDKGFRAADVAQCWASALRKVSDKGRPEPPLADGVVFMSGAPTPTPRVGATVLPMTLDELHADYRSWLGAEYDLGALDAVLAAAAVEQLGGDPVWLLLVGGSGHTKTETVAPLAGAGAHVTSTITSEGALLSATSKKETARDASGGLLRKIGPRGVLVLKDFTSILSMNRDQRAAVLAALREVYDGRWERNVGTDGGRTLTWEGRLVLIGAVTTAYDTAHSVVAAMGDRFALVRVDSTTGRLASGRQALANIEHETQMRGELSDATRRLLAHLDPDAATLDDDDMAHLLDAANLVTLARTAVEYDGRGEVIDAHAPEMPTRFVKMLGQLVRGGRAIGMDRASSLALAVRVARDSMPPLRLAVLTYVLDHPGTTTADVTKGLQKPRSTVDRALQALHVLGLLQVHDGLGRGWRYELADQVEEGVLRALAPSPTTRNVSTGSVGVKRESAPDDQRESAHLPLGTDNSGDRAAPEDNADAPF